MADIIGTSVNYNDWLEIAWLQHQADEEKESQARVVLARKLYEGWLPDALIREIAAALLSEDAKLVDSLINIYRTAIDEICDRLTVADLVDREGNTLQWAIDWWDDHNMDELQHDLWEIVLKDSEAFLMLAPEMDDEGNLVITPILHERFTSAEVEGENQGMKAHYPTNEPHQEPHEFSKRWVERYKTADGWQTRQRLTLYTTGNDEEVPTVQKYRLDGGVWKAHSENGDALVIWTDDQTIDGQPLPMPIIHFKNQRLRHEGKKVQGIQILLDNLLTALTKAAGIAAVPPLLVLGTQPTIDGKEPAADGKNLWKVGPGAVIGNSQKTPDQAQIDYIKPPDLSQLITVLEKLLDFAAVTAVIPALMTRHGGSGQTAAESLKQLDIRPTALARKKQTIFGNAITKMFDTLIQLNTLLEGSEEIPENFDGKVYARWLPADVRGTDVVEGTDEVDSEEEQQANVQEAADAGSSGEDQAS
jgi:hypothetical protein